MRVAVRRGDRLKQWVSRHRRLLFIVLPSVLLAMILLTQLLYPRDRLVPLQKVDGTSYGFSKKDAAVKSLDGRYKKLSIKLYFGNTTKPQFTPGLHDIGTTVKNNKRIADLTYPWYWRLVPTSLLWVQNVNQPAAPQIAQNNKVLDKYLSTQLQGSCSVEPQNATAKVHRNQVVVVPEEDGGECDEKEVKTALAQIKPLLPKQPKVRINMEPRAATLTSDAVTPLVDTINNRLASPIQLKYGGTTLDVPADQVRGWLDFSTEGDVFAIAINPEKSDEYLYAQLDDKITRPAGITRVTTKDFVEVSREDGAVGRAIDTTATRARIADYLLAKSDTVEVGVSDVAPKTEYTRTYSNSDTGLSALMKHFAETNPGTYGVSLIELDGKRRRASFDDTRKFTTASTYKLYVAFSALKRIESGQFKWSDQIAGGRNLEQCFEDMIAKSDNPCAEALVAKIGYRSLTQDAHTVVSTHTTFLDTESYKTTAGDLSTFMASLATKQLPLREESIERLTASLKRNIYRQGVPAGATGTVANKVGFLEGFLHDAAIVYSPSGTYALSIMTDGSSWANIAKLTQEIEKLKAR